METVNTSISDGPPFPSDARVECTIRVDEAKALGARLLQLASEPGALSVHVVFYPVRARID